MTNLEAGGHASTDRSGRRPLTRSAKIATGLIAAVGILAPLLPATGAAAAASWTPGLSEDVETVTADALPTVQIDGVVWDQVIVGDRVYATGDFANARPAGAPPGTNQTPRANILAYDLHTGALINSWAPSLNSQGLAIAASPDGSRIYVGGDFDQVNGQWRSRIAAIDAQTGAVVADWNPSANTRVSSIVATTSTVYFGGYFTIVGGQERVRLAAVNAASGSLLPWAPAADMSVDTLAVHEPTNRVFAGGKFTRVNGQERFGTAAIDGQTGDALPWPLDDVIHNGGSEQSTISGLTVDGDVLYGVGWVFYGGGGEGNTEGVFAADAVTGELLFVNGCLGDRYGVAVGGDVVYSVGHQHDCGPVGYHPDIGGGERFQYANAMSKNVAADGMYNAYGPFERWHYMAGLPASDGLHWLPTFSAGSFSGSSQAAWTVEATDDYVVIGGEFPKVNGAAQQGLVRFAVADIAPDAQRPLRFDEVTPRVWEIEPGTVRIEWTAGWDRDDRTLTYELLRGPQAHNSAVLGTWTVASDRWDRPLMGFTDATAPAGTNRYRVRMTDPDGNGGPSVSTAVEVTAGDPPTASSYAERVASLGATSHWRLGEASGDVSYDMIGGNNLSIWNQADRDEPGALLNEDDGATSWPPSSSTSTVRAASQGRQVGPQQFSVEAWFTTTTTQGGKLVGFGQSRTGRSSSNVTDRHIYMTDNGRLVFGLRPDYGDRRVIQSGPGFNDGQWHHVVATLSGDAGARLYIDGKLAAEDTTLTKAQHYWGYWRVAGDRLSSWPTAPSREAFAGTIDEVAIYPTALNPTAIQGNYVASGRTLDGDHPPVAAFEWTANDLLVDFDALGSFDIDGEIATYEWDFGDGSSVTTADPVVSHAYSGAGTYPVTLVVVDDDNLTDTTTSDVDVVDLPPVLDTFERTEAGTWGSAEAGGSWSHQGPASSFGVEGGTGKIVGNVAGGTRAAYLEDASVQELDLTMTMSLDQAATGGGTYVSVVVRRVSTNTQYRAVARFLADGRIQASIIRQVDGGAQSNLGAAIVPGIAYTPSSPLNLRVRIGDDDQIQFKVWDAGAAEPGAWVVSVTDATPVLSGPGAIGIIEYVSGSSSTPVALSVDDLKVQSP